MREDKEFQTQQSYVKLKESRADLAVGEISRGRLA